MNQVVDTVVDEASEAPAPKQMYQRTNSAAKWSLVLSLLGLAVLLPVVGSVLGIQGGKRALKQIDDTGEGGGGIAEAAIVFGWFGLISVGIIMVGVGFIVVAAALSQS